MIDVRYKKNFCKAVVLLLSYCQSIKKHLQIYTPVCKDKSDRHYVLGLIKSPLDADTKNIRPQVLLASDKSARRPTSEIQQMIRCLHCLHAGLQAGLHARRAALVYRMHPRMFTQIYMCRMYATLREHDVYEVGSVQKYISPVSKAN